MRGQQVNIPFLGINNQLLDDQALDGLCDSIVNLKPKGAETNPYWAPFERINTLKNASSTAITYEYGMAAISDAFWQVRNQIGEFSNSPTQSLKRLLVLCQTESRKAIDIVEPSTWTVVATQTLPTSGAYSWTCTRVNQVTVIALVRNQVPFKIYYLIDDLFIEQGWPIMPKIGYTVLTNTYTEPEILAGDTTGIQRKTDQDQWFMICWAFRLFDGSYVRHSKFTLIPVVQGLETEFVTVKFEHLGYETPLPNLEFWEGLISGVALFCTLPKTSEKEALDDGVWYEVGFFPWVDKLPSDQWPTATDPNIFEVDSPSVKWATFRTLNIDSFSHHRFSARVVDTYNARLLLGGSSVDFALPDLGVTGGFDPDGGPYTNYLDFLTGNYFKTTSYYDSEGNIVDPEIELWDYETFTQNWSASFQPLAGREFKDIEIVESFPGSQDIDPPGGLINLPSATYIAQINLDGEIELGITQIESTFGPASLADGAYIIIRIDIGPIGSPADEVISVRVSPGAVNPIDETVEVPYFVFGEVTVEEGGGGTTLLGNASFQVVTIKTDAGTYYRIKKRTILDAVTEVTLGGRTFWYPDRRATRLQFIVKNGSDYEVAFDKKLVAHPSSNYAYGLISESEVTYTLGTSTALTTEPDLSLNDIQQWVRNRIQASFSGNPFYFDALATYRVGNRERDTILAFGINLNPTSEGQAGQYPVYAFSDKGVWALEQTGDPTIAFGRISPVSNFNGVNNTYAITNAGTLIVACDNKYIYAMAGLDTVRLDEAIANDPQYKEYLKQIRIGYHRATDYEEVIFSNPFYDYSLCYSLKYKVWYKATERFKFFFYDYPELLGMTLDNTIKDFSDKDVESPVAWSLQTRLIQFQQPYVYKRMFTSFVRMALRQPVQPTVEQYLPVNIQLKGYRDDNTINYTLFNESIKTDFLYDPRIYIQWGSMYAYRLIMSGTNYHKNGQIQLLDTDIEYRYQTIKRRFNCSARYLYAMQDSQVSLCECEDCGDDECEEFVYVGTAEESRLVTHNLGKVPSVFVTDENGNLIDCGVQLVIEDGVVNLNQMLLTFEDPINYRAYFNSRGDCAFFVYEGTPESTRIITHNLGKIPSVFVTGLSGFEIEVGVRLIPSGGGFDLNRIALDFDTPVGYRVYLR